MSFEENNVQEWLSSLKGLDVEAKNKMYPIDRTHSILKILV